jgi:hypothetical protein
MSKLRFKASEPSFQADAALSQYVQQWAAELINNPPEGTLVTWPDEVNKAAIEMEDALLTAGAAIEMKLMDGGYHDQQYTPPSQL